MTYQIVGVNSHYLSFEFCIRNDLIIVREFDAHPIRVRAQRVDRLLRRVEQIGLVNQLLLDNANLGQTS